MSKRADNMLLAAYRKHREADKRFQEAFVAAFPPGREVRYRHGSHYRSGIVDRINEWSHRVRIITDNGAGVWKTMECIIDGTIDGGSFEEVLSA